MRSPSLCGQRCRSGGCATSPTGGEASVCTCTFSLSLWAAVSFRRVCYILVLRCSGYTCTSFTLSVGSGVVPEGVLLHQLVAGHAAGGGPVPTDGRGAIPVHAPGLRLRRRAAGQQLPGPRRHAPGRGPTGGAEPLPALQRPQGGQRAAQDLAQCRRVHSGQ